MSQTAKSGVIWILAISASDLAVKRKVLRKTTAINGRRCSIPLQPNPPEYVVSSSKRRKTSVSKESEAEAARKDDEEDASGDGEEGEEGGAGDEGAGYHGPLSNLKSFEKVLPHGAIHSSSSGLCRLFLPRAFCEMHNVENHVTMRDSTGHKLWHMSFQLCGFLGSSRPTFFGISNGWREFSYDHSLKFNDRLVFTLLSTSEFLVEFATQNGSTRAMLPTSDGEDYPWKISKTRLDSKPSANEIEPSHVWQEAMQEKVIRKNMAPTALEEEDEHEVIRKRTSSIPPEFIAPSSCGASKKDEEGAGRGGDQDGKNVEDGEDVEDGDEREEGEEGEEGEASEAGEAGEESEDNEDGEDGEGNHWPTSTLISFTKVLARGAIHTAESCRLALPRAICDRYNVENHVTMTDSTRQKQWQMRLQSWGTSLSSSRIYAISNGWREFSYDHSLKLHDRLVFTLLSTSQFLVEFATANGSSRAMLPTRDGEEYPWKINVYRLHCLSYANDVGSPQAWQKKTMLQKTIRKNAVTVTLEEEDEHEVIRKNIVATDYTSDEDVQEELRALSGGQRELPIILPNKQPLQEMFCQCDTAKVRKGVNTRKLDTFVIPELTHLECKNADGSSYLQILDSDSDGEMT